MLITAIYVSATTLNILFITNVKPSLCHLMIPLSKHQRISLPLHVQKIFNFSFRLKHFSFLFFQQHKKWLNEVCSLNQFTFHSTLLDISMSMLARRKRRMNLQ